jgi:hypothetical protein
MPKRRKPKAPASVDAPPAFATFSADSAFNVGMPEIIPSPVRRYLAETGLAIEAVLAADRLAEMPDFPHARARLTDDELEARRELGVKLQAVERWAWLAGRTKHPDAPAQPVHLPAAEGEAVLAALTALPPVVTIPEAVLPDSQWPTHRELEKARGETLARLAEVSPTYRAALERREALDAKARLSPAELRRWIAERLTRPDGTVAPSPADWCAANGEALETFRRALYAESFAAVQERAERAEEELKRERPRPIRQGTAMISTLHADKRTVKKAQRKRRGELTKRDEEARELFLEDDYIPLNGFERMTILSLANLAWDAGLLEAVPASRSARRIINEDAPHESEGPESVRFLFPGYAAMVRRLGAPTDEEGRVPQNYTRAMERAFKILSTEARWIGERVLVKRGKDALEDDFVVRKTQWITLEKIGTTGETFVELHAAACTAMLASFVERPNLLAQYEHARKAIGAGKLRDDFVALEDYLRWRLQSKKAKPKKGKSGGEIPTALEGATEADRHIIAEVKRTLLWEKMGWDEEAKKRGRKEAQKREAEAIAFCQALGLLVEYSEKDSPGGAVLVFTLNGSEHPDPSQGTLFLPAGEV